MANLARVKGMGKREKLKEQAAVRGISEKEYFADLLKSFTPFPHFVEKNLRVLSEGSGVPAQDIMIYHLVNSMSLIAAQVKLTGEVLVNPFLDFDKSIANDWEELRIYLEAEYQRMLLASNLLVEKK